MYTIQICYHQNLSDIDFDISRSLKAKFDSAIGFPIHVYGFLLMFNINIGPNKAPLLDISLQNLGDLEFDLSRSLKVESNGAIGAPLYMVSY